MQLWGERRIRTILNIVDHLPRNSAFVQALTDDDEWAERMLAAPQSSRPSGPRLADWSAELEMLTNLFDAVRELTRVVAMTGGAKPGKVRPAPRPVTALDRARHRRRKRQHQQLVARLLPHKQHEGPPSS